MEVVITDVTNMSKGFYCVAGWSQNEQRMIRPLNDIFGHQHWSDDLVHKDLLHPGNQIEICPSIKVSQRKLPHRIEDTYLRGRPTLIKKLDFKELTTIVSDSVYPSLTQLFGEELVDQKYIHAGCGLRSLGGLVVSPKNVSFEKKYGNYYCKFLDNDKTTYTFKITSKFINDNGLSELLVSKTDLHIRIGLANPWNGPVGQDWYPSRCYAMVNGIFPI